MNQGLMLAIDTNILSPASEDKQLWGFSKSIFFGLFILKKSISNWMIIALQCYVGLVYNNVNQL